MDWIWMGGRNNATHRPDGLYTSGQNCSGALSPSQASGSNDGTAPSLALIMGAINELKREMDKLKRDDVKKADYCLHEVDKDITKAATILVKLLTVLDKVARDGELNVMAQEVAKLNGALLGNAHYRHNLTRRTIISRDINPKYSHLCSEKAPLTGLLFGEDLSQTAKQIEEADRLRGKFSTKECSPFWSSTYGRFGGGRQWGYFGKVPSRGGSSRFQPYEPRRGAAGRDARLYYPGPSSTSKNLRDQGQYLPRR
ncbi:hypothetical protein E2C01_053683 [Portunus trituberculatus]|uniref:Uncharacterized protein n=1 Tax=Portunus trituberculatus TaxID=210409 RepID=A0A5B7GPW7_PORTR|nr:hypothetical protein [Portunus trituberculatus]